MQVSTIIKAPPTEMFQACLDPDALAPGIRPEDNQLGCRQLLRKLAALVE